IYKKRSVVFIAGPSGCGKTTFSVNFMNSFLNMNPSSKAFIFTANPKDKTISDLKSEKIKIIILDEEDKKGEYEIDPAILSNAIVFFDDMDFLLDEKLITKIQNLIKR